MAIAYKGFELSIADSVTFETKQIIRKFEYAITDKVSNPSTGDNKTLEQCEASLLQVTTDYKKVTGICFDNTPQGSGYLLIQEVLPLILKIDITLGSSETLKIRADNNKFAIGVDRSAQIWNLYNEDKTLVASSIPLHITYLSGSGVCGFLAVTDFDGGNIVFGKSARYVEVEGRYPLGDRYKIASGSVSLSQNACDWFNSIGPIIQSTDPYFPGGTSETGGGGGPFTDTTEPIDFPTLPTLSAVSTGFVTLYIPTLAQLLSLATYMWNADVVTLDFWKKVVADPINLILGLNILPVSFVDTSTTPPTQPPTKSVVVGFIDTEINMYYTTTQYVEVDCGEIEIGEYYGAYLDYAPYTKIEIFLPYCGTHPLAADEVMGKTVAVKYHIDILSGACVAYVKCGDSVLYQFTGNCASQIPVTAQQFGDMIRSAISIASSIGTMVATGGLSAPITAAQGITAMAHGVASAASTAQSMKPEVEKSGAIGGTSGLLAVQTPYLIVTRPKQCIPENQNAYSGYPSYVTKELSELQGFNVVSDIHIEGVNATSAELDELERIIKEGAIY